MKKILFAVYFCISFHWSFAQDLLSQKKAERYFKTGIELLDRHEFGAARQSFEDFVKLADPRDQRKTDAEYYQSLCALNLYHADGEKLIGDFISAHPNDPHAITAFYDLGNFFYVEKNYSRAIGYYAKVDFPALGNEQQNVGRFRWGYSLFTQKKLKEALDQFNFIKSQGGQYGPASGYYAGFIEYSTGDFANALADLKRAEQNPSYAKIVPYMIANAYYKQKHYSELLTYINSIKDNKEISNQEEIALLGAEAYFKKDDYKNALIGYQRYLTTKENADRGVLARAGYSAFATSQDKVALSYFKGAASDKDSTGFYASYYLGVLYLKQQQKPLALTAFDNARKLRSDPLISEESTFQYCKISFDLGQSEQGILESEKFLKTFAASTHATEIKELLSQAYSNANNYNKAIEYIESLPQRSPAMERSFQKATYLKGAELFNKEDYAQAVTFFDKSLQSPVDPILLAEASLWSGEAYSLGKKYEAAIPRYDKVIALQRATPDLIAKARYGLGYSYFNQKEYDKALFNFKEFVGRTTKTNPNYTDALIRLGDCYYVTNDFNEALSNYKKAILLKSPDNDYAYKQEGIILGNQRKYVEAAFELDQVIKLYPGSSYLDEAMFYRAQFDFVQGNYESAIAQFSKIIAANKPSRYLPNAYQRRAAAYYNLKEYNKTADDYGVLIEKYASHPISKGVLLPLQEALTLANRPGDFDKYMAGYKSANPDAKGIESIEFEAAKNLYFSENYQKAITSLGSYISTYPDNAHITEAKYYRAESMYRLKDNTGALAVYNEIAGDNTFSSAAKVTARIAELTFKQGGYSQAIPEFQKLAKTGSTKRELFNAWSGLMESYFQLAKYDSADAYARLILEKGKVNAGAENKASLYLGKSAMARGDYESAKDEFLNTLNNARDEYGAEAKYLLAEIFYNNKEYKQCYETLVSLNADFAPYTEWVGRSFLLMSDNYIAMGDNFQARGTLKSLIEKFPLQDVKDKAKEKLKKLDDAEALKRAAQIKADTTDH